MPSLAALFLLTAVLYASVGFGGGSTYNALLVLADTDYRVLPSIALICNLIVVLGGTWRFQRAGHLDLNFALPFVALSVPAAFFGGLMPIDRQTFVLVLGLALLAAGLLMLFGPQRGDQQARPSSRLRTWAVGLPLGGAIGLLAGMVGIGGGIFLAPCLHLMRLAPAKQIAATASLFIAVNSASGLVGQVSKSSVQLTTTLPPYLWLFAAVFVGGQIGSRLGAGPISPKTLRRLTGLLVLYVSLRLVYMSFA